MKIWEEVTSMSEEEDEIESSKLGTKEYWDEAYARELRNFEDHGDEGELWFGREAETRIVRWVETESGLPKDAAFLDLGTGNGHLLSRLWQLGYTNLMGVDYSPAAVELARKVAASKKEQIRFEVLNVLEPAEGFLMGQFDVLFDKGTWDAISLGDDREKNAEAYRKAVLDALKPGGRLMFVSCNFTRAELESRFGGEDLVADTELPAKAKFSFGGASGGTTSGVVFRKIA